MVYFGGLLLLLLMGIGIKKNNDKMFLIWSAVLLILIMSLRSSSVGTDSQNYTFLYRIIANGGTTILSEKAPLFTFILKGGSFIFGDSPQAYFFLTSLMVIAPMWIAIYISGVPSRTAVILYYLLFFQQSLNGTRTFVSVSLVMLSYFLLKKRTKTSVILSLTSLISAFFIHKIAIIGFAIVGTSYLKIEKKNVRNAVIVATTIISLSLGTFLNLFLSVFPVYADTLETVNDMVGASAIVFQVPLIISLILSFYLIKKRKDSNGNITKKDYDNMAVLIFSEVILYIVAGKTWYIQRVLLYLEMFIVFLFPVIDKTSNRYRKIYRLIVYTVSLFLFTYGIYRNLNGVIPYEFCW